MALARRNAYLRALGIDVWVPRAAADKATPTHPEPGTVSELPFALAQGLHIGPGNGDTLLLCNSPAEAATRLAADIARCLDSEPVWSWPVPAEAGRGISLQQAIEQRLFTRVLVFGQALEAFVSEFVSGSDAHIIASARILCTASIAELACSAAAKRALWSELCAHDWCAGRAGKE